HGDRQPNPMLGGQITSVATSDTGVRAMKDLFNHRSRLGLLVVVVLLVLITVGTRITAAQPSASTLLENGEAISIVVSPETGGELTSPDGQVTITFPPGLFSETTVVTYTETAITSLPPNLANFGPSFTL
ncbi:hypothetical protein, partial [Thermogutta sp.]|uniref:hypothetical protein n=1 Tax=Thermogutta sp. TaxID=1962930 RepID=UPI0032207EB0